MEEVFDVEKYKTEVEESASVRISQTFHLSTLATTLKQILLQVQIFAEYQALTQTNTSTTVPESVTFPDVSRILFPILQEMEVLVEVSMDY